MDNKKIAEAIAHQLKILCDGWGVYLSGTDDGSVFFLSYTTDQTRCIYKWDNKEGKHNMSYIKVIEENFDF